MRVDLFSKAANHRNVQTRTTRPLEVLTGVPRTPWIQTDDKFYRNQSVGSVAIQRDTMFVVGHAGPSGLCRALATASTGRNSPSCKLPYTSPGVLRTPSVSARYSLYGYRNVHGLRVRTIVVRAQSEENGEENSFAQIDSLLDSLRRGEDRADEGDDVDNDNDNDNDNDVGDVQNDDDDDDDDDLELSYPEPPPRARSLRDLLSKAGVEYEFGGDSWSLDVSIENIITCNSDSSSANALYVCVPSEDGEEDGHDWVEEAVEMGAVAVIAEVGRDVTCGAANVAVVEVEDVLSVLACLASEFYERPATRMNTVAFVGSYGKTTSSWLTRGVFEENEELTLLVGDTEYALAEDRLTREGAIWHATEEDVTLHRDCSVPFHVVPYRGKYELPMTTPDGLHLQKVLAGGADRGAESAVVEVCPGSMRDGRCDARAFRPEIVVFTNADEEKARTGGDDFDEYLERIGEYFAGLDAGQIAIINKDDMYGDSLERLVEDTGAQMLTYGVTSKDADVYAEKVKASIWETEILVKTPVGRLEIIVPLIGEFNVRNVLAAVAVGLARGIKLVNIVAGIEAVDVIPGRSELVEEGQPFPVIVDSASTPQQLSKLIDEVKEAGARKTILVMGCKGSSDAAERAAIGNMLHFKADTVFFTNDSPGACPPDRIIADMISGMPEEVTGRHAGSYWGWLQDPHRVPQWFQPWLLRYQSEVGRYIVEDRFSAIRVAVGLAKPKDVVIIAGRGHVDFMEYWDGASPLPDGGTSTVDIIDGNFFDDAGFSGSDSESPTETVLGWFDDRVEARNAVAKLRYIDGVKDLDRSTLPWTRYPEERENSALSATVGSEAAAASGQNLGEYLKEIVVENQERDEDSDDEDEDDEYSDAEEDEDSSLSLDLI